METLRERSNCEKHSLVSFSTSQYKQIGNAVPVNMAYHIGKCAIAMLECNKKPIQQTLPNLTGAKFDREFTQFQD
ncbi:MAG: hypothetical protein D6728_15270 [Cyanobacteria bacterium J055]|nr:MAG: hypothetical protein D6728_15270 [Cyanobacteria bacterium J055]